MKDIRKLSTWKEIQEIGFTEKKYFFSGITNFGAVSSDGLVEVSPEIHSNFWRVTIKTTDKDIIDLCKSHCILTVINNLKI